MKNGKQTDYFFILKRNEEGDKIAVETVGQKLILDRKEGRLMTGLCHQESDPYLWMVIELYTGLLLCSDSTRQKVVARAVEMAGHFFNLMFKTERRERTLQIYEKNHKIVLEAYNQAFPEALSIVPDPDSVDAYVRAPSFLDAIQYKEVKENGEK